MSDPVYSVPAIAIPGLKIAFHTQFSEVQALSFEAVADSTISLEDLHELLDRLRMAKDRQKAMHDLPLAKKRLAKNLAALMPVRRRLAQAQADASAHIALLSARRNKEVPMPMTDVNAVKGAQDQLSVLEQTIEDDRLTIAYHEAIIAGVEPPDPLATVQEDEPAGMTLEAAE